MDNKVLKFKTNLNCNGCVSKVQSDLDAAEGIQQWKVDIDNADKILTVNSNGITKEEVVELIKKKGYNAEELTSS